ncbi:unnamed protein product [Haemonchus placei]|uniref:MFS domain-containing protein n=1 Tax=Haemonchus placei TaxID=6290 RepID=A0A0N4X9F8_HAEPC|nr:unnamed protein product [Haemonchus placei]
MMVARVVTGFGAGTLTVLRTYAATASVPRDRLRVVSLGTAGFVLGLSFGPALQAGFTPIGDDGYHVGPLVLNMYTVPAFFMVIISLISCVVVVTLFKEDYAGIVKKDGDGENLFVVVPKYDVLPAVICIYLWIIVCMVGVNIEV